MTALKYDIEIEQGADFLLTVVYKNPDGTPIDLSTHSALMQVKDVVGGRVLLSPSTANGQIVTNALGSIFIRIPFEKTLLLTALRGTYSLFIKTADNLSRSKLIFGNMALTQA